MILMGTLLDYIYFPILSIYCIRKEIPVKYRTVRYNLTLDFFSKTGRIQVRLFITFLSLIHFRTRVIVNSECHLQLWMKN